MKTQFLME